MGHGGIHPGRRPQGYGGVSGACRAFGNRGAEDAVPAGSETGGSRPNAVGVSATEGPGLPTSSRPAG
jgi:hypothetical protein